MVRPKGEGMLEVDFQMRRREETDSGLSRRDSLARESKKSVSITGMNNKWFESLGYFDQFINYQKLFETT